MIRTRNYFMTAYKTISDNISIEIAPIKKSRFIGHVFKVENEDEINFYLNKLKTTFPDANHHCWAYALVNDNKIRFSDDGEPSGSAGRPILAHIQGKSIVNVLVVVTRYFGGTKLGVGGLVRSYGQAAKEVLDKSTIIEIEPISKINIEYHYEETSNINIILNRFKAEIVEENFTDVISQTISINIFKQPDLINELTSITKAKVKIKILD